METKPESLYIIDFEPAGKRVQLSSHKSLMDAALLTGQDLITSCNGLGICASCKIRIMSGSSTPLTSQENNKLSAQEISDGVRLACQVYALSDLRISIPPGSLLQGQQLQVEGRHQPIEFSPAIQTVDIQLKTVLNTDSTSLWRRLQEALETHEVYLAYASLAVLQTLPAWINQNEIDLRIVYQDDRLIQILPAGKPIYGLAIDLGSTKLAIYWVDLLSGAILKQSGLMNPQIAYGEDVVNRIAYANMNETKRQHLQTVLITAINQHITETLEELGAIPEQIVDMIAAGNSAIHHLFCALPVRSLGEAPYVPVSNDALSIPATHFNFYVSPGTQVYLPPLIAGYVGADHMAALAATRFDELKETACLIDVGTNTEISLIHDQQIVTCSCASGPAFEGAHIQDGMRAAPGAIEKVSIIDNEVVLDTIGARKPIGICGSGILSAVAEMQKNAIIDARGVFQPEHPLTRIDGKRKFINLTEKTTDAPDHSIQVTRKDVHEIQLAKGAIRTGIEVLCREAGITPQAVLHYFIAGAFGSHLDISSAVEIGMFPDVPLSRYQQIGNAAGVGAREMLINLPLRQHCEDLLPRIKYIELTAQPGFQDLYVSALALEKSAQLA